MEEKELIKKLEETTLPGIEIASHKRRLKTALLKRFYREKRSWEVFDIFRKLVPAGAITIVLLFLAANNLIFPQYNLVKAKEIALQDPQIKEWTEGGATIKEIEVINGRAYALIQPPEKTEKIAEETTVLKEAVPAAAEKEFFGALAEINLKEKKVARIEEMASKIAPLIEKEKEKARDILQNNTDVQKIIPKEAIILEMESPSPQLKLIRGATSVEISPQLKEEVNVIYEHEKKTMGK